MSPLGDGVSVGPVVRGHEGRDGRDGSAPAQPRVGGLQGIMLN